MTNSKAGLCAVTGATGHIGANLVRALIAEGRRVRAAVRKDRRALMGLDIDTVEADINDPSSLERLFEGAGTVFHLASLISITGSQGGHVDRTNVEGTGNVVDACIMRGVRKLVHFSSIHAICHGETPEVLDETCGYADDASRLAYDRSKALAEKEVLRGVENGLDAVIVNPTAVLGPHDYKPSRMGEVIRVIAEGGMRILVGAGFDWVDVRDVVAGAIAAEKRGRTGERYLLSGHFRTIMELARIIDDTNGSRLVRVSVPARLAAMAAPFALAYAKASGRRPLFTPESLETLRNSRPVSSAKAAAELGYTARPLEDTIRDTCSWMRETGMLR